jgi:hypothetical protein
MMIPFQPPRARARLGQISGLTGGLVDSLAQRVVAEAEPVTRQIVRDERNRFAEALIGGVPYGAGGAVAYVGTRYLVPDRLPVVKAGGYAAAAILAAVGAWQTIDRLREPVPAAAPPSGPSALDPVVGRTATAIVAEAEPRVRKIMDEERARIAAAAQAGIPFAVASGASFLATLFLVKDENRLLKVLGYAGTAVLLGAGAWVALEREKEQAA